MKKPIIISLILGFMSFCSYAQVNSRDNNKTDNESWRKPIIRGGYPLKKFPEAQHSGEKPHARDIGGKKDLTLKEFNHIMDKKVEEYYHRIKMEIREDKMLARKMRKPQYSDPLYFGHKRKPVKHKPGHRKFCKECGIVH